MKTLDISALQTIPVVNEKRDILLNDSTQSQGKVCVLRVTDHVSTPLTSDLTQ